MHFVIYIFYDNKRKKIFVFVFCGCKVCDSKATPVTAAAIKLKAAICIVLCVLDRFKFGDKGHPCHDSWSM